MTLRPRTAAPALALAWCLVARAAEPPPLPRDAGARVERVAEGVYVIVHDDATDEWPHGNTGVIVGEDAVLVLDPAYLPSRARADVALARKLTPKPVRWVAITHWHFDHNNGTVAWREAWPAAAVVAERESARWIELNATYWARMSTAPESSRRKALAEKEAALATEKDPAARKKLERVIAQRRGELEGLAHLQVVTPDVAFDGALSLDLGGRKVLLEDQGRANSPHDVTLRVPDAGVLFTGDIVVQSPLPYTGGSWPVPWIEVLRRLERDGAQVVVPGHGPVMHDFAYPRKVRGLLEAVTARVEALARQGRTLEQVQAEIRLDDLRTGPWAPAENDDDWKYTRETLVERAWRGVRGQGG